MQALEWTDRRLEMHADAASHDRRAATEATR
jgi:hypothetical protein